MVSRSSRRGHIQSFLAFALLFESPIAQNISANNSGALSTTSGLQWPSGYSTTTYNFAAASTYLPNDDFSNEQLAFLWDQVGPISTGAITTTVSPTAEPSVFPTPGDYIGHQLVPAYLSNLSEAQLPTDFIWGVASAAFQVEGAAKDEGKGPSIWDFLPHRQPGTVADNSTGDVASNHYYLYKQDFARLKALGIPYNSQSISWPRIFPFGKGPINIQGVAHYDDVILEQVHLGITPVVTLFHWDTPLALFNEYGAWTDSQIIDDFVDYAKFVIQRYDKYVPIWYTFNEPQYCQFQYSSYPAGIYYPAYHNLTRGYPAQYACGHNLLLAHARVAKWYHNEFHGQGLISVKNSGDYFAPNNTNSAADLAAVQRFYDFQLGWFGGAWTNGDYPASMRDTLGDILPTFTDDEKAMIRGSMDFYAIDPYSGLVAYGLPGGVQACVDDATNPAWPICAGASWYAPNGFPLGPAADPGSASWLRSVPPAIRGILNDIKKLFPSVPNIVVSEFGFVEPNEGELTDITQVLWDLRRSDYLQAYLDNILAARVIDGVNVTGAFVWAVFDNMEWFSGKVVHFGLQYINWSDPMLTRTPKASMFQVLNWFNQHGGARLSL